MQPLLFSPLPFFLLAVSIFFFSFPSQVWFSGSSEGKKLAAVFFFPFFFSQTVVIFVWYIFKNPARNFLAFVTYTLIFVNLPTSSNIQHSLFWSFSFFSFFLKVNWSGGENTFTNFLRRKALSLSRLSSNAKEIGWKGNSFSFKEKFFYLRKENNKG